MDIRIKDLDHLALLQELAHLRRQRDELQESNTKLELENRDLRKIARRIEVYPPPTPKDTYWLDTLGDAVDRHEFEDDEKRRITLWARLRDKG